MAVRHLVWLGLALSISTAAHARALMALTMTAGEVAPPPDGFVRMCIDQPLLCTAANSSDEKAKPLTDRQLMRLAKKVNRRVNRQVRYQADVNETWTRPEATEQPVGDCEDYAIEKRLELIDAGFPAASLHFAVGYIPEAGLHTVLLAEIGGRDVVLDNRTPWTMPWFKTSYIWVLRQSHNDPLIWHSTHGSSEIDIVANT